MPRISVIVPVYNVELYINRCIDSILNQTFKDFELILVDDGSPDNCGKICDEYAKRDKRVKVIHKENGGVSRARNTGIDKACGEYIAFVDSDDYVDNVFLQSYVDYINANSPDIIHSGLRSMPSGEELTEKFPVGKILPGIQMVEETPTVSKDRLFTFAVRFCFRRNFLNENHLRFNENIWFGEDTIFNIQAISKAKTMVCTKEIAYNYVRRNDSATSSFSKAYNPTIISDLTNVYLQIKSFAPLLEKNRFKYIKDITERHIYDWIPSCIINFNNAPKGFSYKHAKALTNAGFVQDGVEFLLDNGLYSRKLQYLYYKAIKNKLFMPLYVFWKYSDIKYVI